MEIIGREKERKELKSIFESGKPELVAVYGRRRVGKTFLIDQAFFNNFAFRHVALPPTQNNKKTTMKDQLRAFKLSLLLAGSKEKKTPKNWLDAFYELINLLKDDTTKRLVLFFDELPWMDTPRSNFIGAFTWFWNSWASKQNNVLVIVCGSSNSYIVNKLINSHEGLYDRITRKIKLSPFSLKETEQYLLSNGVKLSRFNITQLYMMLGGIPYYLEKYNRELSFADNIDNIFFKKDAKLSLEFDNLFSSTFDNDSLCRNIVTILNNKNKGYSKVEILKQLKLKDGGEISKAFNALIESDFIIKYRPFGGGKKDELYALTDLFSYFYLRFVKNKSFDDKFLNSNLVSQAFISWRGYAFEKILFIHTNEILNALRISGIQSATYLWSKKDDAKGAQVDLIIERKDNIINLCEAKFINDEFVVDKSYHQNLINRERLLSESLKKTQSINQVLITTVGLKRNEYSDDFTNVILLDDLFM